MLVYNTCFLGQILHFRNGIIERYSKGITIKSFNASAELVSIFRIKSARLKLPLSIKI